MSSFDTCKKSQGFSWAKHIFFTKFKMVAKRYVKIVIPELINIYFGGIAHFHMIY